MSDERTALLRGHAAHRSLHHRRAEALALGVAGAAVLASSRVRWIGRGAGSTLDGQDLANSLRNGVLVPDWGDWIAAGMYLLVALGGLILASSGFRGRVIALVRLAGGIAAALPFAVAAVAGWFPPSRWSFGPVIIVVASVIAVVVSGRQLALQQPATATDEPDVT